MIQFLIQRQRRFIPSAVFYLRFPVIPAIECDKVKERGRTRGKNRASYHVTVGLGSPTQRHSKVMLVPSSDCLMTGRSVKVGFMPSSGTGASSPGKGKTFVSTFRDVSFLG